MHLAKETLTRHVGLDKLMQTSLREIEQKAKICLITESNISEKPGAVVPHAGICAGDARRLVFLP
jgi:hypothetical protein